MVPDIWTPSLTESEPMNKSKPKSPTSPRNTSDGMLHFRGSVVHNRGIRLSQSDFAAIDAFMAEFLAPRIYGYISNCVKEWERDVASSRRGISNRLFKVGMKYFGGSKQGSSASSSFVDPSTQLLIFSYSSPEMIMRRLGDYAFMIRDYKYASSIYESVKKDFSTSEKYFKFYAGVQV